MKAKYVEIVLENCEVYKFKPEDVNCILEGIDVHYWAGRKYNCVKHCLLEIKNNAKAYGVEDWQEDWRERLRKQDITQIWLDGVEYCVDWPEEDRWTNPYQTSIERDGVVWQYIISKSRESMDDF